MNDISIIQNNRNSNNSFIIIYLFYYLIETAISASKTAPYLKIRESMLKRVISNRLSVFQQPLLCIRLQKNESDSKHATWFQATEFKTWLNSLFQLVLN